jgi:two-component system heavy metal sensor histidine kinase CusS
MKLSISQRLATMFAAASFVTLAVLSFAMHGLLERELGRHQNNELRARWEMYKPLVLRNQEAQHWQHVRAKFDSSISENNRVSVWVLSDDSRFRYGPQLTAAQLRSAGQAGFGQILVPNHAAPLKTYSAEVEGRGERPPVRLMVGIDSTPFVETLRAFTVGLVALTVVGALGSAALGYYIARVGMRPIERLSREAQELSPGDLSRRLQTGTLAPELSQLADSFNGALARLEAAYQQLEAFNADVAHELRTPLGNLIGQTQVTLSRERNTTELKEALHSNLEDLERLRAIVNDMLFHPRRSVDCPGGQACRRLSRVHLRGSRCHRAYRWRCAGQYRDVTVSARCDEPVTERRSARPARCRGRRACSATTGRNPRLGAEHRPRYRAGAPFKAVRSFLSRRQLAQRQS